ncbi:hypothetical protein CsSME_00007591 [Camellia sinensis var. sinensis]
MLPSAHLSTSHRIQRAIERIMSCFLLSQVPNKRLGKRPHQGLRGMKPRKDIHMRSLSWRSIIRERPALQYKI